MSQVDWRQQQRFDLPLFVLLPCFNIVFFRFFHSLHEILSVLQSREKCFGTNCTLTLRMYPVRTKE